MSRVPAALVVFVALFVAVLGLTAVAGQQSKEPPYQRPPQTSAPQATGEQTVMVTGCVQQGSQAGTYLLAVRQTPLSTGMSQHLSGNVPSPTYQLNGHTAEVAGLVGHRVEVKGTTEKQPEKTVQTQEKSQSESPKAQGTSGRAPKVETKTREKVEVRALQVQSVQAVEGSCK